MSEVVVHAKKVEITVTGADDPSRVASVVERELRRMRSVRGSEPQPADAPVEPLKTSGGGDASTLSQLLEMLGHHAEPGEDAVTTLRRMLESRTELAIENDRLVKELASRKEDAPAKKGKRERRKK